MTIRQFVLFQVAIQGDGSSVDFSIDISDMISNKGIRPKVPAGIQLIQSTTSISSSSLSGQTVSIVFASPPSQETLYIYLLF